MDSKSLMIGDWVYNTFNQQAEQVVEIRQDQVILAYNDGNDYDEIEPIPLTAEILEKNGWKLMPNPYKLEYSWSTGAIEEYADIHICVGKDHSNVWRWDFPILNIHLYRGDIELTKFRYVHEMQHALKLCGINKTIKV